MEQQTDEVIAPMTPAVDGSPEAITSVDEIQVEVVDDRPPEDQVAPRDAETIADTDDYDNELTPDESEAVGQRMSKRIGRLRYEFHEQRREKEAADRMREEAVRFAQHQQSENERLRDIVSRGEEVMLTEVRSRTKSDLSAAEQAYAVAAEDGDPQKMLAAQKALNLAQIQQHQADMYSPVIPQQGQPPGQAPPQGQEVPPGYQPQYQQQQAQYPPQQMQPPVFQDQKLIDWMGKNTWFKQDAFMTDAAMKIHRELTEIHGVNPMTDEYYTRLDSRLRSDHSGFFKDLNESVSQSGFQGQANGNGEASAQSVPSVVAASAGRAGGGGKKSPRVVQLTSTQKATAERFGLSQEQYALEVLKMEKA